ncbi:AAA family ATPase [Limosilactobacillus gastricus]|uniref:AAA family ATPase n=1 Tax=Limosilactobacillus gastricus TaxID=227942 RepID=UPI0026E96064|nr:AAA family ATPase [Limosilactobacillus gastricus]
MIGTNQIKPPDEITPEMIERVKKRNQQAIANWPKILEAKKKAEIKTNSLWSGDREISFRFKDWVPAKQKDHDLAFEVGKRAFVLAKLMEQKPINVVLTGNRGTGKTSLALAMVGKVATETGQSWIFINTQELHGLISKQFDYPEIKQRLNQIQGAIVGVKSGDGSWYRKPADILVLDDFGTEGGMNGTRSVHKTMQEWLYQVSNARIDLSSNQLTGSTIITTNLSSNDLMDMYDTKLISRLVTKNPEQTVDFNNLEDIRNG